jgi:hypothetical protein
MREKPIMKAIQVSYSNTTGKFRAKAEGVPAIFRSIEQGSGYTSAKIAQELAEKYNWLTFNGEVKYRLEQAFLPNGDDVFVFVELPPKEPASDIRRDLRLLLEKYKAQLVALNRNDHQPSIDVILKIESTGKFPRDTLVEFDYSVVNINDYELSEEAIADE